jgi:myo-inositol-1(or 4)-monophosphatase
MPTRSADLDRIDSALHRAGDILRASTASDRAARRKESGDPVTEVELAVNAALREILVQPGDGWLSEETADNADRLARRRVWIIDPIDGTREFVEGIPEYAVSIGLSIDGEAVAGGILNPATGELMLGERGGGVTLNGRPARPVERTTLDGAVVLASRSEVKRGEWTRFLSGPCRVVPMGSVAYKFARVAVGLSDVTWTLVPKNEWDVAAGVALVLAGGGVVSLPDGGRVGFNRKDTRYPGLVAAPASLAPVVMKLLGGPG